MPEPDWWEAVPPDEVFDPAADWEEDAESAMQPGGGGTYTRDDATEALVGTVPTKKLYDFRRKVVGYHWADSAAPWELHRVNPLRHPFERQLRATKVDLSGFNLMGKVQPTSPPPPPLVPPICAYEPATVPATFPARVHYSRRRATVTYRPHSYPFLTDEEMVVLVEDVPTHLPEYYRSTTIFDSTDPTLQLVMTTGEPFLVWQDIPAAPPAGQTVPTQNAAIESQQPDFISKCDMVMIWWNVPLDYISDPYIPSKILKCIGCVNEEDNWLTVFPAGTLKLEAPRIRRSVMSHIRPAEGSYFIPFCCDVYFPFRFVDPAPAPVTSAGGVPTFRGWNLFTWSNTGKFFSVRRRASTFAAPLPYFPFAKFDTMFDHVLKP